MPPPIFAGVHAEFLADESAELDFEGARSSGKSWACCAKVILSCLKYPGIEWLISRYSGEETRNKLKPEFFKMCGRYGVDIEWNSDESAYLFPEVDGKRSKVFAYGLKTQDKAGHFAKIRGLGIACFWGEQAEEFPEDIALELRAVLRQPGYPHQLIFSPNPPNEDSWLADQFPEENPFPNRVYRRVSLYDNAQNLDPKTIEGLEQAYPSTHAKHKSLILGERGPNVTGTPVYEGAFLRSLHVAPVAYDPKVPLLQAFDAGKHHPTWLAAQRSPFGALHVLGGVIGKRLFLEDFLPVVSNYSHEWFPHPKESRTACDPLSHQGSRYTTANILINAGMKLDFRDNGSAPDVRVSMIEHLGALMLRRSGSGQAFVINADPSRWLMASHKVVKQTKLFVDACEGSYVWSPNYVSVGNKTVRIPEFDQWLEGWQRCLENIMLNFCADQPSDAERLERERRMREEASLRGPSAGAGAQGWMIV